MQASAVCLKLLEENIDVIAADLLAPLPVAGRSPADGEVDTEQRKELISWLLAVN